MKEQTTIDEQSSPLKKRKPRYWMWFLAGFIVFVLVISWMNRSGPMIEIQPGRFSTMVTQRAIKKIILVHNEMVVEVTLKPESLRNVVYRAELEQANSPFGIELNGPHYKMTIASVDKFYRDYEEATQSIPREDRVDVYVEVRNDITGMLMNWAFLGLIVFGMVKLATVFTRRRN